MFIERDISYLDNDLSHYIMVDGSVNKNPGELGVVILKYNNTDYFYKYICQGITNQITELFAIMHAIDFIKKHNTQPIVISDSLFAIKILTNQYNSKTKHITLIKQFIQHKCKYINQDVILIHQHKKIYDIGKNATNIIKQYNKSNANININIDISEYNKILLKILGD